MNRTSFLKTLAGLCVAPFAAKILPKAEVVKVAPKYEKFPLGELTFPKGAFITGCMPAEGLYLDSHSSFPAIRRDHTLSYKSVDE